MYEILLILFSLAVSFLIFNLYRRASGQILSQPNMLSMPLLLLGPLILVQALLISLDSGIFKDDITDSIFYGSVINRLLAQLLMYWLLCGIALGVMVGNSFFNTKRFPKNQVVPLRPPVSGSLGLNLRTSSTVYAIILYLSICTLFYALSIGHNDVLHNIASTDFQQRMVMRNEHVLSDTFNPIHRIFTFESLLLVSIFINVFTTFKRPAAGTILNVWGLLLTVFVSFLAGSTSSIMTLGLSTIFTNYALRKSHWSFYFYSILLGLSVLVYFIVFKSESEWELSFVFSHIARRALFDQTKGFYYALQIFPEKLSYIGITSSPAWFSSLLLGNVSDDYGIQLMKYFNPQAFFNNMAGHFTSIVSTEMWANFGFAGAIAGPLWIGFVLSRVHLAFSFRSQSALSVSIYCYLSTAGLGLWSDFVRYYYPVNLIFSFFGLLFILSLSHLFTSFSVRL